ncbi:hypothetical protein [Sphingomonas adhaesiva]|uniref:hypothetical protein n=1 Tax=Sphingomonas adhaesiva TaxID=28212 RepID=UPI002FF488E0
MRMELVEIESLPALAPCGVAGGRNGTRPFAVDPAGTFLNDELARSSGVAA